MLLLAAFVVIESRSTSAADPPRYLQDPLVDASNRAMLFVMSGLFAMFYFASLYVQDVLGYSPLKAGLAFLPVTAGIVIGAGLSQVSDQGDERPPRSVDRGRPRCRRALPARAASQRTAPISRICCRVSSLMSIGMGLVFVPLTLIATTNISPGDAGLASGLLNTTQQVGGALGLAVLSTLATSRTNHVVDGFGHPASIVEKTTAQVDGYQLAFTAGAFLMLAAGLVVIGLLRRSDVATIDAEEAVTATV